MQQLLLRICVRNPQSAHLCLHLRVGGRTERHRVIVDNEPTPSLSPIYTVMAFRARQFVFVVHFVAKRYVLQQKCLGTNRNMYVC